MRFFAKFSHFCLNFSSTFRLLQRLHWEDFENLKKTFNCFLQILKNCVLVTTCNQHYYNSFKVSLTYDDFSYTKNVVLENQPWPQKKKKNNRLLHLKFKIWLAIHKISHKNTLHFSVISSETWSYFLIKLLQLFWIPVSPSLFINNQSSLKLV